MLDGCLSKFLYKENWCSRDFLLKPYGRGNLSLEEECFNKRLSRSRKTVEYAFGILVSKWGILDKPIKADTELIDRIVKCVCILHNAIIDKDGMDHNYTETEQTRSDSSVMWNRRGRPSNGGLVSFGYQFDSRWGTKLSPWKRLFTHIFSPY